MSKPRPPCGTNAAYMRHIVIGETPCQACRNAHAAYAREHRAGAAAGVLQRAAMEQLAAEYPDRFREICTALVTGDGK